MKIRLVKETDSFGRESWFCQFEENNGSLRFISGSVATSEAEATAKFEAMVSNYGIAKTEIICEQELTPRSDAGTPQ